MAAVRRMKPISSALLIALMGSTSALASLSVTPRKPFRRPAPKP